MALNLITAPTPVAPAGLADYVAQNNLLEAGFLNTEQPLRVISGNIPESTVLQIGDAIYRADGDTAIGGVASDYVKVTPAGATAAADYVASLAGVTWNKTYNGYYDVGGNLYIFDEGKALAAGQIATVFGRYLMQNGDGNIPGNITTLGGIDAGNNGNFLKIKVMNIGDWDMNTDQSKAVAHGLTKTKILAVTGYVRNDSEGYRYPFGTADSASDGDMEVWVLRVGDTNIDLFRLVGGQMDSVSFQATSYNRGELVIIYEV